MESNRKIDYKPCCSSIPRRWKHVAVKIPALKYRNLNNGKYRLSDAGALLGVQKQLLVCLLVRWVVDADIVTPQIHNGEEKLSLGAGPVPRGEDSRCTFKKYFSRTSTLM